ncbi:hypothetical protein [Actinomadura rubrisoli]|uniref:Transmembrane protein n=1 Tax=Actinomadura rubrisoli TaxID=2530368 RepID=A0A4R4ZV68_9ACTN|nr:hypothetical protein [Actinomadura rubrisoli]TDD62775.1 hypothetical protein E1298_44405 [Actinomadura rubrisoli]
MENMPFCEAETTDEARTCAVILLAALVPVTVAAWLMVLDDGVGACMTSGESCNPDGDVLWAVSVVTFWCSAVVGVIAVALPSRRPLARRVRPALVCVQGALVAATFFTVLGIA